MAEGRYIIWQNVTCVEAGWLVEAGIVTADNYRRLTQRGDVQVVRRGCRNTPALVAVSSMPERFRKAMERIGGDPYAVARQNRIEKAIEPSAEASAYYDTYKLANGRILPAEKRREYYANAVVLTALGKVYEERDGRGKAIGMKSSQTWEELCRQVQDVDRREWPINLPENARKLKAKLKAFQEGGYETLIHKMWIEGNKNAAKVKTEEQEGVLVTLLSDPRNLDSAQVATLYNHTAEKMGWEKITRGAVESWKTKKEDVIYARRHGEAAHSNEKAMTVKRRAPEMAMAMWVLDGWDAELFYQEKRNGRTMHYNRLTVEMVIDPSTKYIIGYAIAEVESASLIKAALRNAERHTRELFGAMYRPHQIQCDNYAKGAMKAIYEGLAFKVTPARVGNAKAKVIEPFFHEFNRNYCQMMPNWSGFGVTSRKKNQPNMQMLMKGKDYYPTKEECVKEIEACIAIDREKKREAYMAAWEKTPTEKRVEMGMETYLELFGEEREKRVLMQAGGFRIEIGGKRHEYDTFDKTFRKHADVQWRVKTDPEETERVLVMNGDGSLRYVLEEKYVQPMALAERKEGDYEELERVRAFNREREKEVAAELCGHQEAVAELMAKEGRRLGDLQKFLLTEGGQHKDEKGKARLLSAGAGAAAKRQGTGADDEDSEFFDRY